MKKILRVSLVAMLAIFGLGNAMAQEVTLDFTLETSEGSKESVWGFPASSSNKTVDEQSFTYGGYTIKVAGSEGNGYYWNDKDKYLLMGKTGAYLVLPAFSFDVERIDIEIPSGASTKVEQNIFVGDEAVSTKTTGNGTKNFAIASAYQAAGNVYTLKVLSNYNTQIKRIMIYKKGAAGDTKLDANISWSKVSASVTLGNEDGTYKYLPTFNNPNSLNVSFTSSETSVATIDNSGNITVLGVGETTLTATFAGNSSYKEAEVTCKLTVNNIFESTVANALAVAGALDAGKSTSDAYKVTGYITDIEEISSQYGNATFSIADTEGGSDVLVIYRCFGINGASIADGDINVGDKVIVAGTLKNYVKDEASTLELTNGQLVSVTTGIHAVTIDDANAPAYSLDGRRVNSNYHGVVIKNGKKVMMK